ncbi:hypothetical protein [Bacillus sp. NPDC094106]|uniref:hypothetical protein n=1 Tax=Bacillus sp. NPDC094106 TaxID=3363949 RepID=UPI00381C3E42
MKDTKIEEILNTSCDVVRLVHHKSTNSYSIGLTADDEMHIKFISEDTYNLLKKDVIDQQGRKKVLHEEDNVIPFQLNEEDDSLDTAFQVVKQKYEDAEKNRAKKLHAYRSAEDDVRIALRQMQLLCPHKKMKGLFFKECVDCGYSKSILF